MSRLAGTAEVSEEHLPGFLANVALVCPVGLNLPTDLVPMDAHAYYVSGLDGVVKKATY